MPTGIHRTFAVGTNNNKIKNIANQPKILCIINKIQVKATIDTGSVLTLISQYLADKLKLTYQKSINSKNALNLSGVSGTKLHVCGTTTTIPILINNVIFHDWFVVVSNVTKDTFYWELDSYAKVN